MIQQESKLNKQLTNIPASSKGHFYELKIIKIKEGKVLDFETKRKKYSDLKRTEEAVAMNKLFQSFYSMPKKKSENVYMEITEWTSSAAAKETITRLADHKIVKEYNAAFETLNSFRMIPEEGQFDLGILLKEGQAIEFGARQIKPSRKEGFPAKREAFMSNIITQKGYVFDREFVSMDEDVNILLFAWESAQDFINAGNKVKKSPKLIWKTIKYFSNVKSKAFQVGTIVPED